MGLPKIDFVLYLRKKGFNFARKKSVKIPIFYPKKSNLGPIESNKMTKSEFTEVKFYSSRVFQIILNAKLGKGRT